MLVLWLGCFMKLFILTIGQRVPQTTLLPYPTLAAIIAHIKELLINMDNKIEVQKSKISSSIGRRNLRFGNMSEDLELPDTSSSSVRRLLLTSMPTTIKTNSLSTILYEKRSMPADFPSRHKKPETLSTVQQHIGRAITTNAPKLNQNLTTVGLKTLDNRMKLKMDNLMKKGTGYCVTALDGIINTILERDMDFDILETSFSNAISRMSHQDTSSIFGNLLLSRIKLITIWTVLSNVASKKHFLRTLQITFQDIDLLDTDVKKILTDYDTFFTFKEGGQLLNAVTDFYNTPREDKTAVEKSVQDMLDAFLAPAKRFQDTSELKDLIYRLNNAYQKRFPDFRNSDINALMDTMNAYRHRLVSQDSVSPRRMNLHKAKDKLEQLLKHLMRNHPKIMKDLMSRFLERYMHNKKSKCHNCNNHHNTHKTKKHTRHMKRQNHHKLQYRQHAQTKQRSQKQKRKSHTISTPVQRRSRSTTSWKLNSFHNRRNSKTHRNRKHSHYSNARRVFTYNDTGSNTTIINTTNLSLPPLSIEAPRPSHKLLNNNEIIQRVDEDYNYSDAETILKTMLNNAFRNPNNTLINNSTEINNLTRPNQ